MFVVLTQVIPRVDAKPNFRTFILNTDWIDFVKQDESNYFKLSFANGRAYDLLVTAESMEILKDVLNGRIRSDS